MGRMAILYIGQNDEPLTVKYDTEHYGLYDTVGAMGQLGVLPAPPGKD
jgi:hypothetical protein